MIFQARGIRNKSTIAGKDRQMAVTQETWWTRFTNRLSKQPARNGRASELPDVGDDGLLSGPVDLPSVGPECEIDRPPGALSRWTRRDQTLTKLQEGYERVTQVVEEVQKHLADQGQRTERICGSLEQLARAMNDAPAIARQQGQTLEAIAGQLEVANTRTQQVVETMAEIPKAARMQSETLSSIKQQLDVSSEQGLLASQTLEKLGGAIGSLGQSNSAQVETLKAIQAQASQQNQLVSDLLARQGRRFLALFVVTVVLAAAAVALGILAIVLQ
jgi:hypothetical protein